MLAVHVLSRQTVKIKRLLCQQRVHYKSARMIERDVLERKFCPSGCCGKVCTSRCFLKTALPPCGRDIGCSTECWWMKLSAMGRSPQNFQHSHTITESWSLWRFIALHVAKSHPETVQVKRRDSRRLCKTLWCRRKWSVRMNGCTPSCPPLCLAVIHRP